MYVLYIIRARRFKTVRYKFNLPKGYIYFFPGRANLSHTQKYQLSKSNRILICNINCSRYANTNCFESINSQLKRQKYTNLNLMVKISIHSTIIPCRFNIMENTYKIFYEKYSLTLPQVIFDLGCKKNVINIGTFSIMPHPEQSMLLK